MLAQFGLEKAGVDGDEELSWPAGVRQVLTNVRTDPVLMIVESR